MAKIASSAIESAAAITSAGMNMAAQKDYNKKYLQGVQETNQTNLDLAEKQNAWNKEQLEDERKYNDPAKQVERLQGAGLSAAAAAQSIEGAGNSSHLESADLANQVAPQPLQAPQFDISVLKSITGVIRNALELDQLQSETQIKSEEASAAHGFFLTRNDVQTAELNLKRQEYNNVLKSFPYSLRSLRYKAEADKRLPALRDLELKREKANIQVMQQNYKNAKQEFDFLEQMNPKRFEELEKKLRNLDKERDVMNSEINKNNASAENQRAEASLAGAQEENVREQKEGIKFENRGKRVEAVLKEFGSPESTAQKVGVLIEQGIIKADQLPGMLKGTQSYIKQGYNWLGQDRLFLE